MTGYYKKGLLVLCLLLATQSYSQVWKSIVTSLCNDINEGISTKMFHGKQYFTGVYRGNLNMGFNSITGLAYDDTFIGKTDINGFTEWIVPINGNQIDRPNHIDVINDQLVVSGTFSDSLFIGNDTLINQHQRAAYIAYFDTLGNHLSTFVPDVFNAEFRHFRVDNDGNILIVGDFYQHFNYGGFSMTTSAALNFFLVKYDPVQDSILWGIQATQGSSEGKKLSIDLDNNIYVAGLYNEGTYFIDTLLITGNANHNMFVSKFDTDGNKLWLNTIEGVGEVHGYGIVSDDSSNVFLVGEFDGDISVGGTVYSSNGFYDAILIKFNEFGVVQWSEGFGGTGSDEGYDIVLDENQDPIVMIESGPGVVYKGTPLTVNGWNEPVLLKVRNDNGDLIWFKSLASTTGSGLVNGISISQEGNFISLTGINRSAIEFLGNTFPAANSKDFYAVIVEDSLTYFIGLNEFESKAELLIYPNPASDKITIKSSKPIESIEIYGMNGQLIKKQIVYTVDYTFFLHGTKPGIYFVQTTTIDGETHLNKIIVK